MTRTISRAGAGCLLAAVALNLAFALVTPTLSDDAGEQASALAAHPTGMHVAIAVEGLGYVALVAGLVWFACVTYPRAPRLALAGGLLGVVGGLKDLFDTAVQAAGSAAVQGLGTGQATAVLDRIQSGTTDLVQPVSFLTSLGLVLLAAGYAIGRHASRPAAVAVAVGAFGANAGFITASKLLLAAALAVLLAALALLVGPGVGTRHVTGLTGEPA